jgi:hypothetical protein
MRPFSIDHQEAQMSEPIHSDLVELCRPLEDARALLCWAARRAQELVEADRDHATALRRHLEYAQALAEEAAGCVREAADWSRAWASERGPLAGAPPAA